MRRYEIFRKLSSGEMESVEGSATLVDAKQRLRELEQMFPGKYVIYDTEIRCLLIPVLHSENNLDES